MSHTDWLPQSRSLRNLVGSIAFTAWMLLMAPHGAEAKLLYIVPIDLGSPAADKPPDKTTSSGSAASNREISLPAIRVDLPIVDIQTPAVKVEIDTTDAPEVQVDIPAATIDLPVVEVTTPAVRVDVPTLTDSLPSVEVDTPALEIQAPIIQVDVPPLTVKAPDLKVDLPEVKVTTPVVEVTVPLIPVIKPTSDVQADIPQVGVQPTPIVQGNHSSHLAVTKDLSSTKPDIKQVASPQPVRPNTSATTPAAPAETMESPPLEQPATPRIDASARANVPQIPNASATSIPSAPTPVPNPSPPFTVPSVMTISQPLPAQQLSGGGSPGAGAQAMPLGVGNDDFSVPVLSGHLLVADYLIGSNQWSHAPPGQPPQHTFFSQTKRVTTNFQK